MELKSAEKYIHSFDCRKKLFQIPNTLMGISFDIQRIEFENGPSPVSLIWSGNSFQPALARHNNEDFYMAFHMCNRIIGNANNKNDWLNYPPDQYSKYKNVYCGDGGKHPVFYFTEGQESPMPYMPNMAAALSRNNKCMSISKLTIFDKEYKYGAHISLEATFEGFPEEEGEGRVILFYTTKAVPLLNG